MTDALNLLLILACILLQAFFSGSEMVLLASNKTALRRKGVKGSKGAGLALEMIDNPRWFLATTSTGTNMFVIISSITATAWFELQFGGYGKLLTIAVMSPILLILGEILPRAVFQQWATELAPRIARPFFILSRLIAPVTSLVYSASKLFYRILGMEMTERHNFVTREELELMLDIAGKGSDLKKKEKKLIHQVFHLGQSDVADIMVPLINVAAIPHAASVREAIRKINQTGFSRIPVYRERIDNLIGIVHALDLLGLSEDQDQIHPFIREVPFVPELQKANDLLRFLQKGRESMAVVVDEYGGAVGIITIEDILEEVVGEIRDEYDREVRQVVRLEKNRYLVNARAEIDYLNERLNLDLPKDDYETLGGFVLKQMGKIPRKGETFSHRNALFTVRLASKRAIQEIVVEIAENESETWKRPEAEA